MKIFKSIVLLTAISFGSLNLNAGNPDRVGESGAYELLINSWARSSGFFGMNTSTIKGLESMRVNPAGLAFVPKTEVNVAYSSWLTGSGINIISGGIGQKLGKSNVVGVSIQSVNFGSIERTTTTNPDGGLGSFKPNFLNIGIGYGRKFSNSIYAGIVVRMVNEKADAATATGVAFDAGVQYLTGKRDQIHFGVAIRNVGTNMKFSGDGFSFRGEAPEGTYEMTQSQRSAKFNLPSQLHIGAGYDFYLGKAGKMVDLDPDDDKEEETLIPYNRLSLCANFTSNSVGGDHVGGGLEYAYREMVMIRVAYRYETGITGKEIETTIYNGLAAGVTFETPLKKGKNTKLGIDYSFRMTRLYAGTHTVGLKFSL